MGIKNVFRSVDDPEAFAYTLMLVIDGLVVQEILQDDAIDEKRLARFAKSWGGMKA
ncbi:MAG: hypothetical protein PHU55_04525 [Bacilli bacterium]|nr:hypothetical protein [Bacilli bacterium]